MNLCIKTILIFFISFQHANAENLAEEIINILKNENFTSAKQFAEETDFKLSGNEAGLLIEQLKMISPQANWIPILEKISEKNPEHSELVFFSAYAAWQAGNVDSAMQISEEGFQAATNTQMQYKFAAIARTCQKYNIALDRVNHILSSHPDHPEARFLKASILTERGKDKESKAILESILEDYPKHAQSLYQFGLIQSKHGKHQEAISLFERAIDAYPFFRQAYAALRIPLGRLNKKEKLSEISHKIDIMRKWGANQVKQLHHLYQRGLAVSDEEAEYLVMQLNKLGHKDHAHQYLEALYESRKITDRLKELLAFYRFNAQNYQGAINLLDKINSEEVKAQDSYWGTYAWTLFYLNEKEKARQIYLSKKDQFPKSRYFESLAQALPESKKKQ